LPLIDREFEAEAASFAHTNFGDHKWRMEHYRRS